MQAIALGSLEDTRPSFKQQHICKTNVYKQQNRKYFKKYTDKALQEFREGRDQFQLKDAWKRCGSGTV